MTAESEKPKKSFSVETDPAIFFRSPATHTPSLFIIQALETTVVLQIRFSHPSYFFERNRHLKRLDRKASECQSPLNEER